MISMEGIKYILVSMVISFILAPVVIGILYRLKLRQKGKSEVDNMIEGRDKSIGIPVMGGSIILITVLILYFCMGLQNRLGYIPVVVLLGGSIIGFLDDFLNVFSRTTAHKPVVYSKVNPIIYRNFFTWSIYRMVTWTFRLFSDSVDEAGSYQTGLKASHKLLMMIVLVGVVEAMIYREMGSIMWIPGIGDVDLGVFTVVSNMLLMIIFAMGFSVADGIDALSPGTQAIAYFMIGLLAHFLGYDDFFLLAMLVVGAELTFYYFNIPPARVEMSDIGTVPLGVLFAVIGIMINRALVLPIIGLIFVSEILSSFLQTFWALFFLKKLFRMAPIHHHFEMMGWSHEKIVMRLYFVAIGVGLSGILFAMSL